jgi:hypothetical protein
MRVKRTRFRDAGCSSEPFIADDYSTVATTRSRRVIAALSASSVTTAMRRALAHEVCRFLLACVDDNETCPTGRRTAGPSVLALRAANRNTRRL